MLIELKAAPLSSPTASPTPTLMPQPVEGAITAANADAVPLALVLRGHAGSVLSVALAPDWRKVASGGVDFTVRTWDIQNGELLNTLSRHRGWVYTVGYTLDGKWLISGGRDRTIRVWDASNGEYLFGMRAFGEAFGIAFSPDGRRFAIASLYSARGQMALCDCGMPRRANE